MTRIKVSSICVSHVKKKSIVSIQSYQASSFKMRSSIIRLRYKQLTCSSIIIWFENITDLKELLLNWTKEVEARLNFSLWVFCLHCGRDHGDEPSLAGHLVSCWNHGHIDVTLSANLLLWNDDLGWQSILVIHNFYTFFWFKMWSRPKSKEAYFENFLDKQYE